MNEKLAKSVAIGPNGIYSEWLEVTPEMAAMFLEHNDKNRRVKDSPLHRLIRHMETGQYRVTHQGVAFDEDGRLADGQHRLQAIVATKRSQWMLVTYNIPSESRQVIDTGAGRSTADNYRVSGYGKITNSMVSMLTVVVGGRRAMSTKWCAANKLTPCQLHDIVSAWQADLEAAQQYLNNKSCNSVIMGLCIRAILSGRSRERVFDFLMRLDDGKCPLDGDSSALRLRDSIISRSITTCGYNERKECYEKGTAALDAFLHYKPLRALRRTESEMFHVPMSKFPSSVWSLVEDGE